MIRLEAVGKRYPGERDALRQVSLHLRPGELGFLTGPSGAGKSTLLRLVPLLERPSQGRVVVGGVDLGRLARRRIPYLRRGIGMIFQDHRLLADRTVFDNVALPLVIAGTPRRELGRRVRAALDKVDLLRYERAQPETLSSGEQQRVGIARAVVRRPPVLLADEPTGNLDPALSAEIMTLFRRFSELGVTTLIATHDVDLVERLGHRRISLSEGRVVADTAGTEAH
ncbi:Cell division ATP-binding protein FtsE [wastewater metagenome]|uniref:Cell division ATP-binding protein FtsE n=2 Tax=unclassified sequences TaxID=12908 RepID=A0A5B8RHN9_9ZZZZ|nr:MULTISPECIES: cell division ATP-binding protein FtsE [Arhodomonas]MCS4503009.1 cell division ATP-binding protein FtsE [Arhodomonas aquaeolei]QEA07112.1 cell division ATP-binding protein FtsE [uncultured organism]